MNLKADSPQKRILHALHLAKHLTGHQLARLLYPEYQRSNTHPAYKRTMYHLKELEKDGLLKSKSYGLGEEMFWFLTKHKLLREMGYEPPKSEIHKFKYQHDKAIRDVFVSLALTGTLYDWQTEGFKGFYPDYRFNLGADDWYGEHEEGNQLAPKLLKKVENYSAMWERDRVPFGVLFTFKTLEEVENMTRLFYQAGVGNNYCAALHSELVLKGLDTTIHSKSNVFEFRNHPRNQEENDEE